MPVSEPTDPDNIISLVKDRSTRFETDHLVLGTTNAWLAIDETANAWKTDNAPGHRISINTFNLLRAAVPNRDNTFHVTVNNVDIRYELRSELRNNEQWAVAETI